MCRYTWSGANIVFPLGKSTAGFLSKSQPNQFRITVNPPQFSNFNGGGYFCTAVTSEMQ
jgi:hypothetical protein